MQVTGELSAAGVLTAIRWAHLSAADQTLADHSPLNGYKSGTTIGASLYELMVDRMDRVAQCGDYWSPPSAPEVGSDLLYAGLQPEPPLEKYLLPPGIITRDDVRGSQGWRFGAWRWLRASFKYGEIHEIPWADKGITKQQVAAQHFDDDQTLFSAEDLQITSEAELSQTLVVAQALNVTTEESQLFIGRPRFNVDGGDAWHWLHDLLDTPPAGGQRGTDRIPLSPEPSAPLEVSDIPVALRDTSESPRKRSSDRG